MTLNSSVPHFYAKIRNEHLYQQDGREGFQNIIVFGVQSVPGRAITFHTLSDCGAVRSKVPIHMLAWKETAPLMELDYLQLWDSFGYHFSVVEYDYLKDSRVKVIFKDKSSLWGSYMMTIDWYNNGYSDEPTQYKAAHLIKLDNGNFALQPNNRLIWKDMSFVTKEFPKSPDWKVDNKEWICESKSDKWVINSDDDVFYYDIKENDN